MDVIEYNFLPEVNCVVMEECEKSSCTAVIGDSPCPCCGYKIGRASCRERV